MVDSTVVLVFQDPPKVVAWWWWWDEHYKPVYHLKIFFPKVNTVDGKCPVSFLSASQEFMDYRFRFRKCAYFCQQMARALPSLPSALKTTYTTQCAICCHKYARPQPSDATGHLPQTVHSCPSMIHRGRRGVGLGGVCCSLVQWVVKSLFTFTHTRDKSWSLIGLWFYSRGPG